jgi:hypothetical protein
MTVTRLLGALVALSIVSACADTATQPQLLDSSLDGAADQNGMVPFRATGTYVEGLDPFDPECQTIETRGTQSGQGLHLGKFTGEAASCLEFTGFNPDIGGFTFEALSADFFYVAANGDEVRLVMDPDNPSLFTFIAGVFTGIGGYDIVGGTGRFEGATGYVTSTFIDTGEGFGTFVDEGMISSPGSIK